MRDLKETRGKEGTCSDTRAEWFACWGALFSSDKLPHLIMSLPLVGS